MSGYTNSFDVNKFNFNTNGFEPENDTTRPIFYIERIVDPNTGEMTAREMVTVRSPGETLNVWGGVVGEIHKRRWPQQYEAFKRGESVVDGTPISQWPEVSGNIDFLYELRRFGFQTVEDVAKMPDSAQRLFHGSLTWKRKAQIFIEQQAKLKQATEATSRKDEVEELKRQLADLQAMIVAKKKPGRPRKVTVEPEQAQAQA